MVKGYAKIKDREFVKDRLVFCKKLNDTKRRRNGTMNFDITFDEFRKLIHSPCAYCGTENSNHDVTKLGEDVLYNGIDRVDSSKGYSIDNCVPSCRTCNIAKGSMSREQFIEWINKVHSHIN